MAFVAMLGIVGLCAALGITTWLVGASSSSGVEIVPIASAPPSGVAPSPVAPSRPLVRSDRVHVRASADDLQDAYRAWAEGVSVPTGVPARALEAYAAASAKADSESPGCRLNWSTLAGIGYVESLNGADGGGLASSGRPLTPIIGVSLTGAGDLAAVQDSDGGLLDGDSTLDRAVGPLQFLPSTWRIWGTDADGDGRQDPQDIDDASLAAARYLCVSGDLGTAVGWTAAVLSYNHSSEYLASVYQAADLIAARS